MSVAKSIPVMPVNKTFLPRSDVVFAIIFGRRKLFCRLVEAVTGDKIRLNKNPHTQAEVRRDNAYLRAIRFDTFAETLDNLFYSMDIQRQHREARCVNRTIFYVARVIAQQKVKRMRYEDLKPVHVSFIYTEKDEEIPVQHVEMTIREKGERYGNLVNIVLVYVPAVICKADKGSDLYTFARFFEIEDQTDANNFVKDFGTTELGKELIKMYNASVLDEKKLQNLRDSDYFRERIDEAFIEEERVWAEQRAFEQAAINAIRGGITAPVLVASIGNITVERVAELIRQYGQE